MPKNRLNGCKVSITLDHQKHMLRPPSILAILIYKGIAVFLLLVVYLNQAYAAPSARELLRESSQYFDKGHYKKALSLIQHIDIRADFDNSDDMKLAFKIRAIAYEQIGKLDMAKEIIRDLLYLDPSYHFDPFDTPPSVVELAKKESALIDEKNKHLASIKRAEDKDSFPDEAAPKDEPLPHVEKTLVIEKPSQKINAFLPFGINHYALSAPVKGGAYLSLQALGLATNIAAFWWKQSYLDSFGSARLKDQSYHGRFETVQVIQYIGLGTLVLSYCASVIDALISLKN